MRILVLALLASCTEPTLDLHEAGECRNWGRTVLRCENPCFQPPPNYSASGEDQPCTATHPDHPATTRCERTFEFDDRRGCCIVEAERASFWQCQ